MNFKPGMRVELNKASGNPGRKAFVLCESNTEPDTALVRFDGFVYNSLTKTSYLTALPDEAFRPDQTQEILAMYPDVSDPVEDGIYDRETSDETALAYGLRTPVPTPEQADRDEARQAAYVAQRDDADLDDWDDPLEDAANYQDGPCGDR